ncbi:MAG TPA: AAA family ATPase, partial [Elusimicrobiota bacterium]|nr:AAA family ATPase [Elusimicrobiota bacterium]
DGVLTDNLGHKVNFKNTVIIMTSNVGARLISKGKSLGFLVQEDAQKDYAAMKDTVMEEVKKAFNPEFLNRLDEIIVFHSLTREDSRKILDLMLKKVEKKLGSQGFSLILSEEAKNFLVETGFDPNYGARPLQRCIQRQVEDPMAEEILAKRIPSGGKVYVDLDADAKKLTFSTAPAEKPVKK